MLRQSGKAQYATIFQESESRFKVWIIEGLRMAFVIMVCLICAH